MVFCFRTRLKSDRFERFLTLKCHRSQEFRNKYRRIYQSLKLIMDTNYLNKIMKHINSNMILQTTSSIISLYRAWDQWKIPAVFYHYKLCILSLKQKKEQIDLIDKEIKSLQLSSHPYIIISDLISARQQSLKIIIDNLAILSKGDGQKQLIQSEYFQNDLQKDFSIVFKSKETKRKQSRKLTEIINHVIFFRKVTIEIIIKINQWANSIKQQGYDGIVQFLYKHDDYIQKIIQDTNLIWCQNQNLFQKNPFAIMKKQNEKNQYALIYKFMKISQQDTIKIVKALQIIANHHENLQKKRLVGIYKQQSSRKRIQKIQKIDKIQNIYCQSDRNRNLINNLSKEFITQKGKKQTDILLKSQILSKGSQYTSQQIRKKYIEKSLKQRINSEFNQIEKTQLIKLNAQQIKTQKLTKSQVLQNDKIMLIFENQNSILIKNIIQYLRTKVFHNNDGDQQQIEKMSKNYIHNRDCLFFVKVRYQQLYVAWLAITFNQNIKNSKRSVNIQDIKQYMKIPTFQQQIINEFSKRGYDIIKHKEKIIYQNLNKHYSYSRIKINLSILETKKQSIKQVVKGIKILKNSRIFKYYTYSRQTKYHKFCQHSEKGCSIVFNFDEIIKINISDKTYLKIKCDNIINKGQLWIVKHHLSNNILLLLGKNLDQIIAYSENNSKQAVQQLSDKTVNSYICFSQIRSMNKYLNNEGQQIIVQRMMINYNYCDELSISYERQNLKDIVIVDETYYVAIVCSNKSDYGKPIVIVKWE